MKIIIEAEPKEIAELVRAIQERPNLFGDVEENSRLFGENFRKDISSQLDGKLLSKAEG